jgi:hypothetical protein
MENVRGDAKSASKIPPRFHFDGANVVTGIIHNEAILRESTSRIIGLFGLAHNRVGGLRVASSVSCPVYFLFAQSNFVLVRSAVLACLSAHSNPTVVGARRRTDFVRA